MIRHFPENSQQNYKQLMDTVNTDKSRAVSLWAFRGQGLWVIKYVTGEFHGAIFYFSSCDALLILDA